MVSGILTYVYVFLLFAVILSWVFFWCFAVFYLCAQLKTAASCVVKILFAQLALHLCPEALSLLFKSICVQPLFEKPQTNKVGLETEQAAIGFHVAHHH